MPNWSANRITLYEDYQLESDNFYNDKDGNYNIKAIFEKFLKDTEEVVEKDGEKRTVQNLMNVMPTDYRDQPDRKRAAPINNKVIEEEVNKAVKKVPGPERQALRKSRKGGHERNGPALGAVSAWS